MSYTIETLVNMMGEEIMAQIVGIPFDIVQSQGNYYENTGLYQSEYDAIFKEHVPERGAPCTGNKHAMLVYAVFKLQREYYRNFFGNIDFDVLQTTPHLEDLKCEQFDWPYHKMLGFLWYNHSESAGEILKSLSFET
jgi:hypothetical protein